MTKQELIEVLAVRLLKKQRSDLTFRNIAQAVQALDDATKNAIVAAVARKDAKTVGDIIIRAVYADAKAWAVGKATTALADDALSLTELEKFL